MNHPGEPSSHHAPDVQVTDTGLVAGAKARVRRVLIADDNRVVRELLKRIVAQAGYEVCTVTDGVQAVQAVARTAFDAVLMDISMPEMSGLEATRAIRAMALAPGRRRPHIIGLSAYGASLDRRELLSAGMDRHLTKPVQLLSLLRALSVATGCAFPRERA